MKTRTGFTLIEFLIALVIIGFIVAILVGVFSNPLKQAKLDSAISQVKDGLRQKAEAAQLLYAQGKCDGHNCYNSAVTLGALSAQPAIPDGINDGSGNPTVFSKSGRVIGGCGGNNSGTQTTIGPLLEYVSDEFCSAFNVAQGLPAGIVKNCADASDPCSASGSTDDADPAPVSAPMFCYYRLTHNAVWYAAGPPDIPCM